MVNYTLKLGNIKFLSLMDILKIQRKIIQKAHKIIKKNYQYSSWLSYFPIFSNLPGTYYLKSKIEKKYKLFFILSFLKFFFSILFSKVKFKKYFKNNLTFNNIYISWGFSKSFDKNGNFFDKYVNKNISKYSDTLIFLIYLDHKLPKKVKPNTVLVYKENFYKNFNLLFFIKYFIKILNFNLFKNMSSLNSLSDQIIEFFNKNISLKKLKKVFVIYEGQPYQKNLVSYFKTKKKSLQITGYDHSAPPSLPLNLFYDKCSPDRLLVTGKEQFNYYKKNLNWPKSKIKIIKSLRFKNEKVSFFQNKIFLPYELDDKKVFLKNISTLSRLNIINGLDKFQIKIHPLGIKLREHNEFADQIYSIISSFKIINNNKKKIKLNSIFIGQTTAMIGALELGFKCYHVCSNPIYDSYSAGLWPSLKVEKLDDNLFFYKLKKKEVFFKNETKFKKIF